MALDDEFPGLLNIVGLKDPGVTGNFEVFLKETGQILHSKSKLGQGKCQTEEERNKVIEKIQEFIDSKK